MTKMSVSGIELTDRTGFLNRTDSTLSWSDSTPDRTLTIAPAVSEFIFYQAGKKYTKVAAETIQITDVEGLHYIYYDDDVLYESVNPSDTAIGLIIINKVLVSIVYWDATNKTAIYVGEERHGLLMSGETHNYLHFLEGTKYFTGLALNTIDADQSGDLNSHAQFGVDAGSIADEDIGVNTTAVPYTTGLPIYYRIGANGYWRKVIQSGFSVKTTGTGRLAWNQLTGGVWQLTEVANTKFVLCHVFATTEKDNPMIAIMGQAEYAVISTARLGAIIEIDSILLGNLPTPEIRPIATVIFQTADGYGNDVKARIRTTDEGEDYVDFRTSEFFRSGASAGDHGSLAGLSDDDHPQYLKRVADYNSGWVSLAQGEFKILNHNVGGNADDYFVLTEAKDPTTLINNLYYGLNKEATDIRRGWYYLELTNTTIRLYRGTEDVRAPQIRVRIWRLA